jgi:outer membrane protein OmpA-like peptidoglycan-associated protein
MKKLLAFTMIAAMAALCLPATAAHHDDMSWWGNTADPEPVPDPKGRSGYWWWPKEPHSNIGDGELWGNRGIVYSQWIKPAPPVAKTPAPRPNPPAVVQRRPVSNTVLFAFDKSTLSSDGKGALDSIVSELKANGKDTITVEGHTCSVGAESYNQGLSERRAKAVVDYLVSQGVSSSRISSVGHGEASPAVANDSAANRAKNRRAYFVTRVRQ